MMNSALINTEINKYWEPLKNIPSEIKLRLISLLSESIYEGNKEKIENSIDPNIKLLDEIRGSWVGPESAEELIHLIRENRTSRAPVNL